MDSGYYAACAGLRAQTQALEVVANNLANINTGGYRGQQPTFHSLLVNASGAAANPLNRAINNFNVLGGTRLDLSQGNLDRTGNSLDLAIEGSGFFAVQTPAGTLYTRKGNFQVSPNGQLTTSGGDQVLGTEGPITLPSGTITISPDGTLFGEWGRGCHFTRGGVYPRHFSHPRRSCFLLGAAQRFAAGDRLQCPPEACWNLPM